MRTYPNVRLDQSRKVTAPAPESRSTVTASARYSPLYRLTLTYLGASILFEFLDQLLFFRLLGFDEITQGMLIARLTVDALFVIIGLYYGINPRAFRGATVLILVTLTAYGLLLGFLNGNEFPELAKDFLLFLFFIIKMAIFRDIFISGQDLNVFYGKLQKYCRYTLYVGAGSLAVMLTLTRLGFSFYEQGISNLEWYVSYAVTKNHPLAAFMGVCIAFLLAKRMVLVSCVVIFAPWFFIRLIKGNPIAITSLMILGLILWFFNQLYTFNSDSINYAIRIDLYDLVPEIQNFSVDALRQLFILIDYPRYLESLSALIELKDIGFWLGGGFGFNYFDLYINEIVSNAHFSPVGFITKFGFFGMIIFYSIFFHSTYTGIKAHDPLTKICGYYVLATIIGSLFTWKFFLSSPLLPMAVAATLRKTGRAGSTNFH